MKFVVVRGGCNRNAVTISVVNLNAVFLLCQPQHPLPHVFWFTFELNKGRQAPKSKIGICKIGIIVMTTLQMCSFK